MPREIREVKKAAITIHFEENLLTTEKLEGSLQLKGLQKSFEKIPTEEHQALDNFMVPFKDNNQSESPFISDMIHFVMTC